VPLNGRLYELEGKLEKVEEYRQSLFLAVGVRRLNSLVLAHTQFLDGVDK
jgi:hypothetical protein